MSYDTASYLPRAETASPQPIKPMIIYTFFSNGYLETGDGDVTRGSCIAHRDPSWTVDWRTLIQDEATDDSDVVKASIDLKVEML